MQAAIAKNYRAATDYYNYIQVDKCLQDGQPKTNRKFKLVVGMQDECCYFTGMVGRYILISFY